MIIHHCALDEPQCQMRDLRGSLRAGQATEVPEHFHTAAHQCRTNDAGGNGAMALRVFRQTRSGDEIIQLAVRLALLAFLLYWSFVLVRPFIPMLAWSMVLTVALYPPYHWLPFISAVGRSWRPRSSRSSVS